MRTASIQRLRQAAGGYLVDGLFRVLSRAGRMHPMARPSRHGVEVLRDLAYRDTKQVEHHLDVYRPVGAHGPLPVVLYLHGGGFRILSKDSHWIMGLAFARRGFAVIMPSYRLAPRHPFPAAMEDACAAFQWMVRNAKRYGADLGQLVLAGESAGANLATSLTIACCYERPEPWARAVFDAGIAPRATVAACGILQVSDPGRFHRRRPLPTWLNDRIFEVGEAYLPGAAPNDLTERDLADPLVMLERCEPPLRPLPPFFAPVGTADPILDDTRRLSAALARHGVPCDARYYEGEPHAFHALVFRKNAKRCWQDCFRFLERHLDMSFPEPAPPRLRWLLGLERG